jgi:hypothetical protein
MKQQITKEPKLMKETQIVEIWSLFKEYLDKKTLEMVAEKYIDLLADYGIDDFILKEAIGVDSDLDNAIGYYLELDNTDNSEWDE